MTLNAINYKMLTQFLLTIWNDHRSVREQFVAERRLQHALGKGRIATTCYKLFSNDLDLIPTELQLTQVYFTGN